jgi:hypothetical protein
MTCYKFSAKLSHFTFRFLKRLTNFLDTMFSGFWLGIMSEKSLDYSDELFYNSNSHYIDDKYNLSGLYGWEKVMIEKYFSKAKNILLIAAGGGREVIALGKMGFLVDSYECNTKLIEYGNALLRKNNLDYTIKYLSRNTVPGDVKKYDGIIIGWGAYSLIQGEKRRLSFLNGLYPFLGQDTPLMISFLWMDKNDRKDNSIQKVANFFRILRRKEKTEPGDRLVPDFIHYFIEEEIRNELVKSKFRIADFYTADYGCLVAYIMNT